MYDFLIWFLLIILVIIVISTIIYFIFKCPFKYPYKVIGFDVSGKRSPNVYDYIDNYLINNGIEEFEQQDNYVRKWKQKCEEIINESLVKKIRTKQYVNVVDDKNMFVFHLNRNQTRYKQSNYVKTPYTVVVTVSKFSCDINFIKQRYKELEKINFECSLSEYNTKQQRKIMKKSLRDQIAFRDNYTCQICGKYMPDGVGLHVDHIVSIKNGGKSIPSNLRVLCSKCNGQKGSKNE